MIKYTPKHQLKVAGTMSEADAGKAGLILAKAVLVFSTLAGVALLIWAGRAAAKPLLEEPRLPRVASTCVVGSETGCVSPILRRMLTAPTYLTMPPLRGSGRSPRAALSPYGNDVLIQLHTASVPQRPAFKTPKAHA